MAFPIGHTLCDQLSWSHYRLLSRIDKEAVKNFYYKETQENNWSVRELERQINSFYYERLLSTQNKQIAKNNMKEKMDKAKPEDIIKDPYVLEFLGLEQNEYLYEKDLEQGLIEHLQKFKGYPIKR